MLSTECASDTEVKRFRHSIIIKWGGVYVSGGQFGLQIEDKLKLVTPFPSHLLVAVVEHGCTHQDLATHPPSPLSLWLTAQLCCVWIRPRIKQEVEIKQKLCAHAHAHTHRHCELAKTPQRPKWQPVEKRSAHTHTLPQESSQTLASDRLTWARQDHGHIASPCPRSCSHLRPCCLPPLRGGLASEGRGWGC